MSHTTEQQIGEHRKFGPLFDMTQQIKEESAAHNALKDRKDALELIKILSALESWAFSTQAKFPDYLVERIELALNKLTDEVLNGG